MSKQVLTILFGTLLVAIGLFAGWFAGNQGDAAKDEAEDEADAAGTLDPKTLKNLGVRVGTAVLSDYVRSTDVQAVVVDRPLNTQPVTAPLGGIITDIDVRFGEVVNGETCILRALREPVSRPALELTADILSPVSENLHEAVASLRTAVGQLAIATAELERVNKFLSNDEGDELPLLPRKTVIDLQYAVATAEQQSLNARQELMRHGLSEAEIKSVAAGELPPGNLRLWRRALEINGLWGEIEDAVLAALPELSRTRPWSVAAVGELAAAGLSTPELATALEKTPAMARHFVAAASLILQGHTVQGVQLLAEKGALEPEMALCAPGSRDTTWDVAEILVRPGEKVETGDTLVLLHDARRMLLRLEPVGDEVRAVLAALEANASMSADPLILGSGPTLSGLRIDRMDTRSALETRGAAAYVLCDNEPVTSPGGKARSWRLRIGMRYLVRVPLEKLANRFVLPAGAVTDFGTERVVFLQDGDTFADRPVHVEYEDDRVVVIANDGSLFPGDPVVTNGAFALGLAMQAGSSGKADPHAGHNH